MRHLGSGAYGGVWEAVQISLNRSVALKFLHPVVALSPNSGEMLRREAEAVAQVNHQNVLDVYGIGQEKGLDFLVTELISGGHTLAQFEGDIEQLINLFCQTIHGLLACDASGVSHCDLSPSNLFINTEGDLVIGDFGISHLRDDDFVDAGNDPLDMASCLAATFKGALPQPPKFNNRRYTAFCKLLDKLEMGRKLPQGDWVASLNEVGKDADDLVGIKYSAIAAPRVFLSVLPMLFGLLIYCLSPNSSNTAISFDGISAFATLETDNPPVENSTWEVWVRIPSTNTDVDDSGVIVGRYGAFNHRAFTIIDQNGKRELLGASPAENAKPLELRQTIKELFPSEDWVHLAIVYEGQEYRIYVDGQLRETSNIGKSTPIATLRMYLGAFFYTETMQHYYGEIDELRISSAMRYQTEFEPSRTFKSDQHTWGLWHFDEGAGVVAADSSGNKRDWQLVGGFSWVIVN